MKNKQMHIILTAAIVGLIAGAIGAFVVNEYTPVSQEDLIKEFYDVETAVMVSPHHLRKHLGEDPNLVLVDLRSQEEYEEEHITGAINIPAYKDKDNSDYGAVERIVSEFSKIKDKEVIVYCYSIPCMTGRKVGKILADHDIYVKELGVGWNEWRYYWTLWNHPHEWNITKPEDYVTSGPEPGVMDNAVSGCSIDAGSELGC